MKVLDLFAGIGGFSLGLERAGMTIAGQCEIDPFCLAVLAKHWPRVWRHDDIRTLTGELVQRHCGRIDLVCGGFPCQDISIAGKGAGLDGSRSGLWREMLRVVREVRPDWILIENVPALVKRGLDRIIDDLSVAAYRARTICLGPEAVGSPSFGERIWILAKSASNRGEGATELVSCNAPRWKRSERQGVDRTKEGEGRRWKLQQSVRSMSRSWPRGPHEIGEIPIEIDGLPGKLARRCARLGAIGNSVVPQIPEMIGRWLMDTEAA